MKVNSRVESAPDQFGGLVSFRSLFLAVFGIGSSAKPICEKRFAEEIGSAAVLLLNITASRLGAKDCGLSKHYIAAHSSSCTDLVANEGRSEVLESAGRRFRTTVERFDVAAGEAHKFGVEVTAKLRQSSFQQRCTA